MLVVVELKLKSPNKITSNINYLLFAMVLPMPFVPLMGLGTSYSRNGRFIAIVEHLVGVTGLALDFSCPTIVWEIL
jgi:hypothetical protein